MSTAERDIAFQAQVELLIAAELARYFKGSFIQPNGKGRDSHKDFILMRPFLVEVKCDYKAKQTRNIFLEVNNPYRKEKSGLSATAAFWWIHYVPGDAVAYIYCPKKMLTWVTGQTDYRLLERCGDNNSDGYAVPIATIAKLPFVKTFNVML